MHYMFLISSDTHFGVSKHCNVYVRPQFLQVNAGVKDDVKVEPELFSLIYMSYKASR